MKTIKLLSLLLIGALTFTSCKNNMSLTKRHYTKGYHFHKTKSVDQAEVKEGMASTQSKKTEKASPLEIVKVKPSQIAVTETKNSSSETTLTASTSNQSKQITKKVVPAETKSLNHTKKELQSKSQTNSQTEKKDSGLSGDTKFIVCIILAILICPLGMYIWNKSTDFWFILDLILFLLLFTSFFWSGGLVGLAAVVIALLRVFDVI